MKKYFLLFTILWGCSSSQDGYIYYDSFPMEKELFGVNVKMPNDLLCSFPAQIELYDSTIWLLDRETSGRAVHKLSYPKFEWVGSIADKGKTDGEYIYLTKMEKKDNELYLLDPVSSKFLVYDIDSCSSHPKRVEKFLPLSSTLLSATIINDSIIVSGDINSKKFLLFQTFSGLSVDSIFIQEKTRKKDKGLPATNLYDLNLCYDGNDILVAVTKSGEVLYIYNVKNKSGNCVVGPHGFPDFGMSNNGSVLLGKFEGFMDVKMYGEYIYAIFSGKSSSEAMTSDTIGGRYVYVYNKMGQPIIKYQLDREILSFCIDTSRMMLYGLDPNSDNMIVGYEL